LKILKKIVCFISLSKQNISPIFILFSQNRANKQKKSCLFLQKSLFSEKFYVFLRLK